MVLERDKADACRSMHYVLLLMGTHLSPGTHRSEPIYEINIDHLLFKLHHSQDHVHIHWKRFESTNGTRNTTRGKNECEFRLRSRFASV